MVGYVDVFVAREMIAPAVLWNPSFHLSNPLSISFLWDSSVCSKSHKSLEGLRFNWCILDLSHHIVLGVEELQWSRPRFPSPLTRSVSWVNRAAIAGGRCPASRLKCVLVQHLNQRIHLGQRVMIPILIWAIFFFRRWTHLVWGSDAFELSFIKTDIKYNLTLDADLQSSRVSPRGHFSNLDRVVQKDISVSAQDVCEEHDVYVQETPDLVNSIALRVDVVLSHPDANPVLDVFSPTAWEFFVSVARSKFLSFKCLWFTVKDMC